MHRRRCTCETCAGRSGVFPNSFADGRNMIYRPDRTPKANQKRPNPSLQERVPKKCGPCFVESECRSCSNKGVARINFRGVKMKKNHGGKILFFAQKYQNFSKMTFFVKNLSARGGGAAVPFCPPSYAHVQKRMPETIILLWKIDIPDYLQTNFVCPRTIHRQFNKISQSEIKSVREQSTSRM